MSTVSENPARGKPPGGGPADLREALYNDGPVGLAGVIQVPAERITRLLGFVLDLDPQRLVPDNPLFPPADDPGQFLKGIEPVLDRHPLARHAEVRASGTGLHAIVRLDPPVELSSAADQQAWATLVRAVQYSLPTDPGAPGITALTRAVGSVNAKNGAVVEVLRPGAPVDPRLVEEFVQDMARAPFRTVATILLGEGRRQPCPVCLLEGTRLDVLDREGMCYGRCGRVTLAQVFDRILRSFAPEQNDGPEGADQPAPARRRSGKPRRPATKHRPARR